MKIIFLTIVCCCCCFLFSEEKPVEIQGLFGYRLGDNIGELKGKKIDPNHIEVFAKIPFRNFTKSQLAFTDDKKIYYITGEFTYPSTVEAEKEFSTILGMLEKKYNTKFIQKNFLTNNGSSAQCFEYSQGDKILFLTLYEGGLLRLNCVDTKTNIFENKKRMREYEQQRNNNLDAI